MNNPLTSRLVTALPWPTNKVYPFLVWNGASSTSMTSSANWKGNSAGNVPTREVISVFASQPAPTNTPTTGAAVATAGYIFDSSATTNPTPTSITLGDFGIVVTKNAGTCGFAIPITLTANTVIDVASGKLLSCNTGAVVSGAFYVKKWVMVL